MSTDAADPTASDGTLVLMPRRVPLPSCLTGHAFRVGDPIASGLSARRLRGRDVDRPFAGVRAVGLDLRILENRCRAYAARMPPGQFFSHITAALLYRIPLPWRLEQDSRIHVSVRDGGIRPRARGVIGHRLSATTVPRMLGELPVADPVSTWCHLASVLDVDELIAAGDFLVSGLVTNDGRRPPLATLSQLSDAVQRSAGRRGARTMAATVTHIRTGVDSPRESRLRMLLLRSGLPEPVINEPVFDADGRRVGKPDLMFPEARLVLEYEGDEHRTNRDRFRRDIFRREAFEDAGYRVKRVTADDLDIRPHEFVSGVRKLLVRRGMSIPAPQGSPIPASFRSREWSQSTRPGHGSVEN
ncbi:hypothetical protein FB562_2634 [Homoserinimonas aerilata]|uniref:DUF559 domain-containing protein n=1 Tax=Homoserinimonas aerilata TaxID=1162970 RepID=A0A542XX54_9MICO|nr:hypothetical protein [Homoserinimonas aerilata]TQL40425.1 hypothetical protein FB562_2634 [Homoserinimonas aerilata]